MALIGLLVSVRENGGEPDTVLDLKAGATRDEVLKAAKGHILGMSKTVGTYQQVEAPLK
ncbi:hypothetical protein [Stenotrophomonas maltophilia]